MLYIDIAAMSDSMEILTRCYQYNDMIDQMGGALDYLVSVIDDERWRTKVQYHKGLWYCSYMSNDEAAREVMESLDYKKTQDLEALSLYYQLFHDRLSFMERMSVIDRLCTSTEESWKLQYRAGRGIALFLIGDREAGIREIKEALEAYDSADEELRGERSHSQYAETTCTLAAFTHDRELALKASQLFDQDIPKAGEFRFPSKRRAELYYLKAQALKEAWQLEQSEKAYLESLKNEDVPLTKVFLAEVMIFQGKIDEARKLLMDIDTSSFDDANSFDLATTWAWLAKRSLQENDISKARNAVKEAKTDHIFFENWRNELYGTLLELTPQSSDSLVRKITQTLNRYVELKPQLFGVGININKIFDDLDAAAHHDREKKERPDT